MGSLNLPLYVPLDCEDAFGIRCLRRLNDRHSWGYTETLQEFYHTREERDREITRLMDEAGDEAYIYVSLEDADSTLQM